MLISNPFDQKADDARKFCLEHSGVRLCIFPKMRHISRKDFLGKVTRVIGILLKAYLKFNYS